MTHAGKEYQKYIVNAKGDHDNPLSFEALVDKFKGLAGSTMPAERVDGIIKMIMHADDLDNINNLTQLFSL